MTGSLVNNILSNSVKGQPVPTVGMGATILSYSDRNPATIIEVTNGGKFIKLQSDTYTRIDKNGFSESQEYTYTANPEGATMHFKLDKAGRWQEVRFNFQTKRWNKSNTQKLRIGVREKYHDFSF